MILDTKSPELASGGNRKSVECKVTKSVAMILDTKVESTDYRSPITDLLGQVEYDLRAHLSSSPPVGVGDEGIVYIAVDIELYVEFLTDNIVDVGAKLEIDISAGDGADIVDLALDD